MSIVTCFVAILLAAFAMIAYAMSSGAGSRR